MGKFKKVVRPLLENQLSLSQHRELLNEMFVSLVANAPLNETENFTANRYGPVYLTLSKLLTNISKQQKKKKTPNPSD